MKTMRGRLASALWAIALALGASSCAALPGETASPRLVVLLVVDGLPQWQATAYRGQLAPDGLNRFLERGAWFADAHYAFSYTVTGAGHATLLTGAYPHRTGIIGNEWRDPESGAQVYCAGDPGHRFIDHPKARSLGTSPRNLRVESLGDVLRAATPASKVIGISGKDRGAVLPAGHKGTAYVYLPETGRFASTTHYMPSHPAWVTRFNEAKPADGYFGKAWEPLLPEMAYARSVSDAQPWMAPGGKLPKVIGEGQDAPGPRFYGDLLSSPFLDALTLDFARAAIDGERLGQDDAPDILVVSLSSHDYINHAWGAESRLSHDHVLQVDNLLAAFFRDLDRRVGADRYLAVLATDHGFMPFPEHARSRGEDGGRLHPSQAMARVNAGLAATFGEGAWARGWSAGGVLLDRDLIASRGVSRDAVAAEAKRLLLAEQGVEAAYTAAEIEGRVKAGGQHLAAVRRMWDRERSPDLHVVMKPNWMRSSSQGGFTTHGSPHAYDTHVPLMFWGPAWVTPGRVEARAEMVDLAPTLASLLRVRPPAASEGRVLPLRR